MNVLQLKHHSILLPWGSGRTLTYPFREKHTPLCVPILNIFWSLGPRWCHGCVGESFTAISKLFSGWSPYRWAPTTPGWEDTFIPILAVRAHIPLRPTQLTGYHIGSRGLSACAPRPSLSGNWFLFTVSHTHCKMIIAILLPLSDWKWSKQGTKRKLIFILSREAGKKMFKR